MKNIRQLIIVLALAAGILFSCKQSTKAEEVIGEEAEMSSAMTESKTATPTANASEPKKPESQRKFIRTADLKFKAKNVAKVTYEVENITTKLGGFVAYTNLQSQTSSEITNKISSDSSVVTKHFRVENEMILRVPNTKLDSTLKAITPLIAHLDFRVIKADDVSLKLLSNTMAQNRASENTQRLAQAINNKGRKLNDITSAEDVLDSKKALSDQSKLENLSLKDQINFSTINIAMYQDEAVSRELIVNIDNGKYDQSLGSRLLDSLELGWNMIAGILVFFTQLWGIFLIGILIFLGYRKLKPEFRK